MLSKGHYDEFKSAIQVCFFVCLEHKTKMEYNIMCFPCRYLPDNDQRQWYAFALHSFLERDMTSRGFILIFVFVCAASLLPKPPRTERHGVRIYIYIYVELADTGAEYFPSNPSLCFISPYLFLIYLSLYICIL